MKWSPNETYAELNTQAAACSAGTTPDAAQELTAHPHRTDL